MQPSVFEYKTTFAECYPAKLGFGSKTLILIRTFRDKEGAKGLFVDPEHLRSMVGNPTEFECGPISIKTQNSNYGRLLAQSKSHNNVMRDAGITHASANSKVVLTVDLCPSHKTFEKAFFSWVQEHNIPIAISLSGVWMDEHPTDFIYLKNQLLNGADITWINHSFSHPYHKASPNKKNFFLLPKINVRDEVLGQEVKMLENGIVPSIFFRFPGLYSDRDIVDEVLSWRLLPIGADAWLALGEKARPGSIILVHGNGNEPLGIRRFFQAMPQLLDFGFESLPKSLER